MYIFCRDIRASRSPRIDHSSIYTTINIYIYIIRYRTRWPKRVRDRRAKPVDRTHRSISSARASDGLSRMYVLLYRRLVSCVAHTVVVIKPGSDECVLYIYEQILESKWGGGDLYVLSDIILYKICRPFVPFAFVLGRVIIRKLYFASPPPPIIHNLKIVVHGCRIDIYVYNIYICDRDYWRVGAVQKKKNTIIIRLYILFI